MRERKGRGREWKEKAACEKQGPLSVPSILGKGAYESQEELFMGEVEQLEGSDSNSRLQHHMFDSLKGCSCREMEGKKKNEGLCLILGSITFILSKRASCHPQVWLTKEPTEEDKKWVEMTFIVFRGN